MCGPLHAIVPRTNRWQPADQACRGNAGQAPALRVCRACHGTALKKASQVLGFWVPRRAPLSESAISWLTALASFLVACMRVKASLNTEISAPTLVSELSCLPFCTRETTSYKLAFICTAPGGGGAGAAAESTLSTEKLTQMGARGGRGATATPAAALLRAAARWQQTPLRAAGRGHRTQRHTSSRMPAAEVAVAPMPAAEVAVPPMPAAEVAVAPMPAGAPHAQAHQARAESAMCAQC
jgi:hypothetical protein